MRTAAIIPAYNEETVVAEVVRGCQEFVDTVLVVDDCSSDDTAGAARAAGAKVLRHSLQRGAGRATATGLQAALRFKADLIVTLDADGQHLPEEIPSVLDPLRRGTADLVVGCRSKDRHEMPLVRRLGNGFANVWTWLLLGVSVSDTQSGYRGYTRHAATHLPLDARGYEFCSHSLGEAQRLGLRIEEVPITVVYTEYSKSKGQSFATSVQTLGRIAKEGLKS
jgi:glycosyltransferase involved in cell wall biosynthesis